MEAATEGTEDDAGQRLQRIASGGAGHIGEGAPGRRHGRSSVSLRLVRAEIENSDEDVGGAAAGVDDGAGAPVSSSEKSALSSGRTKKAGSSRRTHSFREGPKSRLVLQTVQQEGAEQHFAAGVLRTLLFGEPGLQGFLLRLELGEAFGNGFFGHGLLPEKLWCLLRDSTRRKSRAASNT